MLGDFVPRSANRKLAGSGRCAKAGNCLKSPIASEMAISRHQPAPSPITITSERATTREIFRGGRSLFAECDNFYTYPLALQFSLLLSEDNPARYDLGRSYRSRR